MGLFDKFSAKKLSKAAKEIGSKISDVLPDVSPDPTETSVGGVPGQAYQDIATQAGPQQIARNIVGRKLGVKGDVSGQQISEEGAVKMGLPREVGTGIGMALPVASILIDRKMPSANIAKGLGKVEVKAGDINNRELAGSVEKLKKEILSKNPENVGLLDAAVMGNIDAIAKLRQQKGLGRKVQSFLEQNSDLSSMMINENKVKRRFGQ